MRPILLLIVLGLSAPVNANEALVAVATNFMPVLEKLRDQFEASSENRIKVTSGSTGLLYAQIVHGAPFDIFFAADEARPALIEESGLGISGSRFTYAKGRLVLWSRTRSVFENGVWQKTLQSDIRRLAIANPEVAPYGFAAREVLLSIGLWKELAGSIVMAENIGQTFTIVATGNADAAFVSLSQVLLNNSEFGGTFVDIDSDIYSPIRQDAIVLSRAVDNVAAHDFVEFLKSQEAREQIASSGYGIP